MPLVVDPDISMHAFILGEEVPIRVQCRNGSGVPANPTAAPQAKIYDAAGTLKETKSLYPIDKYGETGWFETKVFLGAGYATGQHWARVTYTATVAKCVLRTWMVLASGDTGGQYISLFHLDRPDGRDFVLGQTDAGSVTVNRGPKV